MSEKLENISLERNKKRFANNFKEKALNAIKRPHIALYRLIKWRLFHAIVDIACFNLPMWLVMAVEAKIYYDTYKWIIGHF